MTTTCGTWAMELGVNPQPVFIFCPAHLTGRRPGAGGRGTNVPHRGRAGAQAGKFYLLTDSPDGMRLIRLKAAHCGLQEGGDGGLGQVGGELGAHPQAAAQQEGMDGTVEVG
jgi:hypothetical protein